MPLTSLKPYLNFVGSHWTPGGLIPVTITRYQAVEPRVQFVVYPLGLVSKYHSRERETSLVSEDVARL